MKKTLHYICILLLLIILVGCNDNKQITVQSNFHETKYFIIEYKHKSLKREGEVTYFTAKDDAEKLFAALKENPYFYKEGDDELIFLCDKSFFGLKKIGSQGRGYRYKLYAMEASVDLDRLPFPFAINIELNEEISLPDSWSVLKEFYDALDSEYINLNDENKTITLVGNNQATYLIECKGDNVVITKSED